MSTTEAAPSPARIHETLPAARVAAIVVTFNRSALLARCLDAVDRQTRRVDSILLVDNASTDGTEELLRRSGLFERSDVEYLRLPTNLGGAGGFRAGMKRGLAKGAEWLWLMDDDGYPAPDCLEKLLAPAPRLDLLGPAVLDPADPAKLTFVLRRSAPSGRLIPGRYIRTARKLAELTSDGLFLGDANLFNGTLIRSSLVREVGLVNTDLFVRGDENDYYYRCRLASARIATVPSARHFHPVYPRSLDAKKFYYFFRNRIYLHRRYSADIYGKWIGRFGLLYILLRYLPVIPDHSPKYLSLMRRAYLAALREELLPYEP